jgi:hypothetical protein
LQEGTKYNRLGRTIFQYMNVMMQNIPKFVSKFDIKMNQK